MGRKRWECGCTVAVFPLCCRFPTSLSHSHSALPPEFSVSMPHEIGEPPASNRRLATGAAFNAPVFRSLKEDSMPAEVTPQQSAEIDAQKNPQSCSILL